uniref:Uncharacterized protein n=1 Tax=Aplanochytrium stocchinoi TaxID=215587 RepID=A0A6S8CHC9_9STRA|mmetsp:Transcript_13300/g.15383  ORF Transcript_13300/g.15383 Transcript_13300/m.15383 type:complete len:439 (-) Transcript_13300:1022-2338(-)
MNVLNRLGTTARRSSEGATGSILELKQKGAHADNKDEKDDTEIASVVITTVCDHSYDHLFQSVPQESELGRVVVYAVKVGNVLTRILRSLKGEEIDVKECWDAKEKKTLEDLRENCEKAGHDAVCFNFECSGGYSDSGFGTYSRHHLELLSFLVKEYGCLTMFSDFSLKALIKDWDTRLLGPNPFVQVGTFSGSMRLVFEPEKLKNSASAQLETVGGLCDDGNGKGSAECSAMASTIVFTITKKANENNELCSKDETELSQKEITKKNNLPYEINVLSVVEMMCSEGFTENIVNKINGNKGQVVCHAAEARGPAGHVIITYPPSASAIAAVHEQEQEQGGDDNDDIDNEPVRGAILASCGHWIELMKVDASMERLLDMAGEEYGVESDRWQSMNQELTSLSGAARQAKMQEYSHNYIQSRTPAKYNKKLVKSKASNNI